MHVDGVAGAKRVKTAALSASGSVCQPMARNPAPGSGVCGASRRRLSRRGGNRGDDRSTAYFRRLEYPPKVTGLRNIRTSQFAMALAISRPSSWMAHSPGVLNQQLKQPTQGPTRISRQRFRFRLPAFRVEGLAEHPVDGVFRGVVRRVRVHDQCLHDFSLRLRIRGIHRCSIRAMTSSIHANFACLARMPHSSVRNQHHASRGSLISSVNLTALARHFPQLLQPGATLLAARRKIPRISSSASCPEKKTARATAAAAGIYFQRRGQPAMQFFATRLGDSVHLAVGTILLRDHLHRV